MSIASELTRIETAKSNLKTSIEGKGVTVPSTATLDAYPTYVDSIQQGGGSSWAEIDTPSSTTLDRMASYITSVDIPTNVTTIGNYAFQYCSSLRSINIPSGVTSIGNSAFQSCHSLTSIDIPSGVTSIGDSAFEGCKNLPSINIPNGVTSIGISAFRACQSLQSITIPSGVTSISITTFSSCYSLTAVTIPSNSNLTAIGNNAFQLCTSLQSIDIPSGVTSIGSQAFNRCESLTSVTIPSGVTSIGQSALNGCSGLTSVTVNAVNPPTLGGSAFNSTNNCPIYVPSESVDTYKAASGWSTYASRIQAIPAPATWELVESSFSNPSYIKVDYSLVDGSDNFGMYDVYESEGGVEITTHEIILITQDYVDYAMEEQSVDLSEYVDSAGYFSDMSDASSLMFVLEDGVEYPIADFGGIITAITPRTSTPWVYAK